MLPPFQHMKKELNPMKKITCFLCVLLFISILAPIDCFANRSIKTGWLAELEALACWNAHQNKTDEKLIFDMALYPTGKRLVDSYNQWNIAACGLIPAFDVILKQEAVIIGLGVDETFGNILFANNNSTILSTQGINPDYPEIYGTADTVRGKTILCTFNSNAHMLVLTWLNIIGLTDQEVRLIDVKPEEALSAFQKGMGDILALWAPDSQLALKNNLKPIATAKDCKLNFITVILANKNFLEKSPDDVKQFLTIYYNNAEKLNQTKDDERARLYCAFLKEFARINLSANDAKSIITRQKVFTPKTFKSLLKKDKNSFLYQIIKNGAIYYSNINAVSRHDKEFLLELSYMANYL